MAKQDELNDIKEELKSLASKLKLLTDEELAEVVEGTGFVFKKGKGAFDNASDFGIFFGTEGDFK